MPLHVKVTDDRVLSFPRVWADLHGPRDLLVIGSFLVAAGAAGLAFGAAEDYWIGVVAPIVISSVGMALVVAPLTTAVMVSAPDRLSGAPLKNGTFSLTATP